MTSGYGRYISAVRYWRSHVPSSGYPSTPLTRRALSSILSTMVDAASHVSPHHPLEIPHRMADNKKSVLIVGGGAVGAIAAVNLEVGGLATVTVVLRSNYNAVKDNGYTIESCDHGKLNGWKPSVGML
jgi:threonine dehydrogenase-like Zn-dependent dehydrogenase